MINVPRSRAARGFTALKRGRPVLGSVPSVLALHVHEITSMVILLVGVALTVLAVLAIAAFRKSGNARLKFVSAAFGVFATKQFFSAWAVFSRAIAHEELEAILAVFDVVIVAALIAPFFLGRGGSRSDVARGPRKA